LIAMFLLVAALLVAGYLAYPLIFERGTGAYGVMQTETKIAVPQPALMKAQSEAAGTPALVAFRNVTMSFYLRIQVEDVKSAYQKLSLMASSYGGYVQSSSLQEGGGQVTLRIPADRVEEALRDIRSIGNVESEEKNVEDVTEQVIDVETRLKNLRATESRLIDLLDKAEKVSDIIEIESKLSEVRQQIEWLEAIRRNLQLMVKYATVSVELRKSGYVPPEEDPMRRIWEDSRRALIGSLYLLVVGASFLALPLTLAAAAYLIYRALRSKRGQPPRSSP